MGHGRPSVNALYPTKDPESELTRGNLLSSTSSNLAVRLLVASMSKSLQKAPKLATRVTKSVIL